MKKYIKLFESEKGFNTMVKRLQTAKLKSTQGKKPMTKERADHLWKKAEVLVKKQYGKTKGDEDYYALVMGIWKRMTGYKKPNKRKRKK